jgi:hypothetical protein
MWKSRAGFTIAKREWLGMQVFSYSETNVHAVVKISAELAVK